MFLVLICDADRRRDEGARALAAALRPLGRTAILRALPRSGAGGAGLIFVYGAAALERWRESPSFGKIPWVFVASAPGDFSAAAQDCFFQAAALWLAESLVLPRGWHGREVLRLKGPGGDPAGILAGVKRLLAERPRIVYPKTSIVVPVYNALPLLRACLASIRRNTPEPHELILVDNASDRQTRRFLSGLNGVRLIRNSTNRGFARAINQGMRAARGHFVAWVNSDLRVTPQWLKRSIDGLCSQPGLGAVGPFTNRSVGLQVVPVAPGFSAEAGVLEPFSAAWSLRYAGQVQRVHRLAGFCVVLKRRAVQAVGELDERFGAGAYEDFDYCLRLRQAGYELAIAKDVFVFHHEHGSFGGEADFLRQAYKNRELFIEKWCSRAMELLLRMRV